MYNDNPTLEKVIEENRQGEVFTKETAGHNNDKKFYIESYGCQMNFSDSEIVASILGEVGFSPVEDMHTADLILINTCSIREKAEETVRKRLRQFQAVKRKKPDALVGVLGCMAERLKKKFLEEEKIVDIVVGPDAYRDLPKLVNNAEVGERGINVLLSREETYADISPLRLGSNGITAFISIMRGCDNMCSFCVVPFTRGRERSRNLYSIVAEATDLYNRGYREITLLGQNVDSYKWENPETNEVCTFAMLLEAVAMVSPDLRIRFSTSHPKDITDAVLYTMKAHKNICKYIHLPVQSGNSRILKRMNRTYDREWYIQKIDRIREIMPDCAVSSDVITGFCGETEEEHKDTLSIIEYSQYSMSYMFFYSERPGTLAARKYEDDVSLADKKRRLQEVINLQTSISLVHNQANIGNVYEVLIERDSKRSADDFCGRTTHNKMVVFPKTGIYKPGDYVNVRIQEATSATLLGEIVDD